jgi:hypothetical protein
MENLELTTTIKMLQSQRLQAQKEVAKLDRAIAVLSELSGANLAPSTKGKKRTISLGARRRMAAAQKARWAKVRQAQKAKS